jgi:hypothetical protein
VSPSRAAALLLVAAATTAACTKKQQDKRKAEELAGLAAVPDTARVVIGADPRRLADSAIVARAVEQMLDREPDLGTRIQRLAESCGVDWRQLESVHLVITDAAPQPMLVATGPLAPEADIAKCVQNNVGAGGGTLAITKAEGRALYEVTEGKRTVYFAFGRKDTIVLSASKDLVVGGLGTGKKALDDADLMALLNRLDTKAPLWAAGKVDGKLGERLLRLTRGKVTAPPKAFLAKLDPTAGLNVELSAVMASEDDAKALESQLNPTLALISVAAQARGLGPLAAKITGSRDKDAVRFGVSLTEAEVNEVLSKVDSRPPVEQDAGPVPATPVDAGAPGD